MHRIRLSARFDEIAMSNAKVMEQRKMITYFKFIDSLVTFDEPLYAR